MAAYNVPKIVALMQSGIFHFMTSNSPVFVHMVYVILTLYENRISMHVLLRVRFGMGQIWHGQFKSREKNPTA